jgi:hypothetical protein
MVFLRKICKMIKTSNFYLAKSSWFGTATNYCKHGCPLLIETTHIILFGIILL